jgi:hypothetical protein
MENNLEQLQKEIDAKIKRREIKKKPKMPVSGKSVLTIQKIIKKRPEIDA